MFIVTEYAALTFIGTVGNVKRVAVQKCSEYLPFLREENLPFKNHLSVPDRPTSTHDVTRFVCATFVC